MPKQSKRRMTFKEFLAAIPKRGWYIYDHKLRRGYRDNMCQCPITSVCLARERKVFSSNQYKEAARVLGLKMSLAENIVLVSDRELWLLDGYQRQILRALLKATGLDKKK